MRMSNFLGSTLSLVCALACLAATPARAETPQQFVAQYSAEAGPGFKASAERGRAFAQRNWGVSDKMPNCVACHTDNLRGPGRHAITGKAIDPLSPLASPDRFSKAAKVEKWFRRNCKEVVGRECTPAEKADFIEYALQGK